MRTYLRVDDRNGSSNLTSGRIPTLDTFFFFSLPPASHDISLFSPEQNLYSPGLGNELMKMIILLHNKPNRGC